MDNIAVPAPTNKDTQAYRIASTLMQLLNDGSVPNALWWLDDDTFAADPKYFQTQVLDPHFRGTKYASFLRTMHKMGFARLSRRFDLPKGVVAYSCELFRKEKPELMHKIRMCNSGKQAQALKEAITKSKAQSGAASSPAKKEKPATEEPKKPKKEAAVPVQAVPKKTKKPDPPSAQEPPTSAGGAPNRQLGVPTNFALERFLAVQAESNARIARLREQTALGLGGAPMGVDALLLQQHQERLIRASLMQPAFTPMGGNFLEMALIQDALAKRQTGPR